LPDRGTPTTFAVLHPPKDRARVPPNRVYKIVPEQLWRAAEAAGAFAGAPVDLADGFIHFSAADQVRETAAKHFAGLRDLLLVAIDGDRLAPALKWEPSRGGALFPHLYAELPLAAILWTAPLDPGEDGAHVFPESFAR